MGEAGLTSSSCVDIRHAQGRVSPLGAGFAQQRVATLRRCIDASETRSGGKRVCGERSVSPCRIPIGPSLGRYPPLDRLTARRQVIAHRTPDGLRGTGYPRAPRPRCEPAGIRQASLTHRTGGALRGREHTDRQDVFHVKHHDCLRSWYVPVTTRPHHSVGLRRSSPQSAHLMNHEEGTGSRHTASGAALAVKGAHPPLRPGVQTASGGTRVEADSQTLRESSSPRPDRCTPTSVIPQQTGLSRVSRSQSDRAAAGVR